MHTCRCYNNYVGASMPRRIQVPDVRERRRQHAKSFILGGKGETFDVNSRNEGKITLARARARSCSRARHSSSIMSRGRCGFLESNTPPNTRVALPFLFSQSRILAEFLSRRNISTMTDRLTLWERRTLPCRGLLVRVFFYSSSRGTTMIIRILTRQLFAISIRRFRRR